MPEILLELFKIDFTEIPRFTGLDDLVCGSILASCEVLRLIDHHAFIEQLTNAHAHRLNILLVDNAFDYAAQVLKNRDQTAGIPPQNLRLAGLIQ